jgi:hypothetical protein
MSETTAGPWVVNGSGGDFKLVARMHAGVMVAAAAPLGDPLLDARLIAAAPDLLALAYALVDYHVGASHAKRTGYADGCSNCGGIPHSSTCHVALAQAAIAKAEGR